MSDAPRLVVVCTVSEACNLGCGFCGYDRSLPRVRRFADPATLRRLAPLLAAAGAARGRRVLVSWLGGEPMIWPELPSLTEAFRAQGLDVSVTTNGTTLGAAETRAHVLVSYAEITVSLDGLAPRHDRLRSWPGGFARLEAALTRLVLERNASGSALRIRVNTVVMRDNLDDLPALWQQVARWGVDEITWNALGGRDRPEFFPANGLRPEDAVRLASLLPGVRTRLPARTRLAGDDRYIARVLATSRGEALAVDDCRAGDAFLYVSVDGRVSPCSFTVDGLGVALDELRCAADVLQLVPHFGARRLTHPPSCCADCHSTQVFGKFARLQ